ncbi:MAG: DNA-directed RNA polymerase subunit L [Candidatus Woesearchaeota archaeon]|nr:DNA-directed RNA polymerase subunit L [Candidatus Woesearchaeota archaeon]
MEINVIEETKNRIVVEVKDEDATLCNIIRKELWNDEAVKAAAYTVKHPSIKAPHLIVETAGKSAREALLDSMKRIKKDLSAFEKAVAKEF